LKLGDLEYAKNFSRHSEPGSHDVRTGTRWFWSGEIDNKRYLFAPRTRDPQMEARTKAAQRKKNQNDIDEAIRGGDLKDVISSADLQNIRAFTWTEEQKIADEVPLTHNPLHELESIFWILLYVFSMRVAVDPPSGSWDRSKQKAQLDKAFPIIPSKERNTYFNTPGVLVELTNTLHEGLKQVHRHLGHYGDALMYAFVTAESTLPDYVDADQWVFQGGLYNKLVGVLLKLQEFAWPVMGQWIELDDKKGKQTNGADQQQEPETAESTTKRRKRSTTKPTATDKASPRPAASSRRPARRRSTKARTK